MSVDQIMGTALRLNASAEALAALGARLRLLAAGEVGDPEVTAHLDHAVSAVGLGDALGALTPEQAGVAAGAIRAFFLQAAELLDHPERPPGWVYEDPALLLGQGQASAAAPSLIDSCAPLLDGLANRLAAPDAAFLDIGSGVAALAIAACRQWPAARVVGMDPWPAAMKLARRSVQAAGLDARIELREQGIEELVDERCFDLVWIPGPFLPARVLPVAVERSLQALRPGGWTILGLYAGPDDPLAIALMELRTIRSGGQVLGAAEASTTLRDGGFTEVSVLPRTWNAPMIFVAGRRPADG